MSIVRIPLPWFTVWRHLNPRPGFTVYDEHGAGWDLNPRGAAWREPLHRHTIDGVEAWSPDDDVTVWIAPPVVPEPPDGTRIEFEHNTDVHAAWRDDDSSARAGYSDGDGGEVWCLFGHSVPRTWTVMWLEFGESLRTAVRLVPHPDDRCNYDRWPTAMSAAAGEKP